MPKLIIDDREIEVPPGTKVIEAAERLGIMIPRFCYHEALGSVGACRMCAVKFLQGPVKGVQMSCMVDAQDGMVVSTTDPEAMEFRRFIIECLMLNHPHDCPVCDEGGQCLLQDETISGGHGLRRYLGKKRTYRDQYLGVFIAHEMNRCIHCYRCSRFYQDFAGYKDLGPVQCANRVYFGRFSDGQLESPFSGNLVDICPTGVYTDKTARFRARNWDLERAPSLCIHCSLGCNTVGNARYREVVRVEARFNEAVNGHFLCDRGRFGFAYAALPTRPRRAKIGGIEVSMQEAIAHAAESLKRIVRDHGYDAVACLGSPRSSLETQSVLKQFCRSQLWRDPEYFINSSMAHKVRRAVSRLNGELAVSMREIESADFILAIGTDPVNEAPMLALAMRQAFRKEARIVVIDPRPVSLPFAFDHVAVGLRDMERVLDGIVKDAVAHGAPLGGASEISAPQGSALLLSGLDPRIAGMLPDISAKLAHSERPVIVCGTGVVRAGVPDLAADCVESFRESGKRCGLFYVLPAGNSFGAALFSLSAAHSFANVLRSIEQGDVKALVAVESDPFFHFPDRKRLESALKKLDFLAVVDHLPSETIERASVVLPTTTMLETGAGFINQEGRLQYAERVHLCGTPSRQASGGAHPPRIFGAGIPGSDPEPAWQILQALSLALSSSGNGMKPVNPLRVIAEDNPALSSLADLSYPVDGVRILPESSGGRSYAEQAPGDEEPDVGEHYELLLADRIFGSEVLSSCSELFREMDGEPLLCMNDEDAAAAGLYEEDMVRLTTSGGAIEIRLSVSSRTARGALVLPRSRGLDWRIFDGLTVRTPHSAIERI